MIELHAGGETRQFTFGGQQGSAVRLRLPRAADVQVRGPKDMPLLVRITTERSERASDHAAWARPIHVERDFCLARATATAEERERGEDLVPVTGALVVGRVLQMRLRITSPVPMRYVVVDCPLPAGFELPDETAGVDRFDDRLAFACDLVPGKTMVRTIAVVPTVAGRMVMPPVVAAPMYVSGLEGGSAGGFVEVAASSGTAAAATSVVCFQGPAPVRRAAEPEPVSTFAWSMRDAWTFDPADEVRSRSEVEALLADLPARLKQGAPAAWLDEFREVLGNLEVPLASAKSAPGDRAWRIAAREQVREAQRAMTFTELARFESGAPDWTLGGRDAWRLAAAVAPWPEHGERDQVLARVIARTRREAPQVLHSVLQAFDGPAASPELRSELLQCLGSGAVATRQLAFDRLPAEDREQLPPTVILAAQDGVFGTGIVELLAKSEAGRGELALRLRDPDFVTKQLRPLVDALPAELWRDVPLGSLAAIAERIGSDEWDRVMPADDVAARVAASANATAELQQAMAATKVPAWRLALAAALRQRDVRETVAAARANDDYWPLWCAALALAKDDATAAFELLAELRRRRIPERLDVEADLLQEFIVPVLVAAGTPRQLYDAAQQMSGERWRQAWTRFASPERVALIDLFRRSIAESFVPGNAAESEAIWRFLMRSGNAESAIGALAGADVGVTCVQQHLAAGEGGEHLTTIRKQFAEQLGLDPATLAPPPGEPWSPVLRRVARRGLAGQWTDDELSHLQRLRALRGVGDVSPRTVRRRTAASAWRARPTSTASCDRAAQASTPRAGVEE